MEKKISNEYKMFLINLIRNGEYFNETYNANCISFSYKNGDKNFKVFINDRVKFAGMIKKEIDVKGFNYFKRYKFCYDNFRFFNNINRLLFKELKNIKKKIDIQDNNRMINDMNISIPKKYLRLKKIEKLIRNEK